MPRLAPLLAALLALESCGSGEDLCGGPFCVIPPGAPEATRLRPGSGDGQTGAPGRVLPLPLEVFVSDDEDRPVPDVEVGFTVEQGGGSLSVPVIRTDHQGRAQVSWTLGAEPGQQTVRVTATDDSGSPLNGSPLILSAQSVRPPPARLVLRQAPSGLVQNGIVFERQPEVAVLDADGDPVPGVNVEVAIAAGEGTLSGTTIVSTDAAGLAAYADLAIQGVTGARTLSFGAADAPLEAVTATVEVQAGPAAAMAGNQPLVYEGIVNSPVTPPPSVVVTDQAGNPVEGAVVTFTADLGASVSPSTVPTDELGVARVTSWTLGSTAGVRYSLSAHSAGGDPVVFSADATPGAAGKLEIEVQPSATALSGTPFGRQPVVRVLDLSGNPAPQPGVAITATVSSGPSGALQNASATTDGSGRAAFNGLTLTGVVGEYRLSFSAPTLAGVTSRRISLAAGPSSRLRLVRQPSPSGRSRVPLSTQPLLELQDEQGNPVAQSGVAVAASIASGGGTLAGGTTAITDGQGRAAYDDLTIIGSPGPRTIRFTSTSPQAEVVSAEVTLPGVTTVTVTRSPPPEGVVVGSVLSNPVSWMLADAGGRPVADVPVALSASAGSSVEPSSATSDQNGAVELRTWTVSRTAGEAFAELEVPDAGRSRVVIQAIPGAAFRMEQVSGDGQSAPVNSQLPEPLVVRALDEFGNGVGGVTVQWRTCDDIGDYDAVTDAGGYASALQVTGPEPGSFCAMASSPGLAGSPVQFSFTATSGEGFVSSPDAAAPLVGRPPAPSPIRLP